MNQLTAYFKTALLVWLTFLGFQIVSQPCFAQENDPGLIRALQTDSAQIENTFYFQTSFNNDTSPYHGVYFYSEGLFDIRNNWGLEVDFPNLYTFQPLGQAPLVLGPIGLSARYEIYRFGGWNTETAGAFSFQAGGAYGISNSIFRRIGSSWSIEALGGYRFERFFFQADYSYQGGIDPQVADQFQFNTALGIRLTREWYLQGEWNASLEIAPIYSTNQSLTPQIAFQPGEWLFEFGEMFDSPSVYTELMVARAF